MQKEQQIYLKQRLSSLEDNERRKLYKRASLMRKIQQNRRKPSEDDDFIQRSRPLEEFVLKILLQEEAEVSPNAPATGQGTVVWLGPRTCTVRHREETTTCQIGRGLTVAIGDRVSFRVDAQASNLVSVLPRSTVLSRPDVGNGNKERVIAANIDIVVVVVSVVAPPLHPNIIDRYQIAIQRGGARMLLAVNKVDLLNHINRNAEMEKLKPYQDSVLAILCSTEDGTGIDQLRVHLKGHVCAFVGHSGVGKSSLVNAFEPSLNLMTGSVSQGYGRGTHTTTSSTLHELSGGTRLIDTPGIRSFGLWDIDAEGLSWYFPEFEEFRQECKFRDCSHTHEPHCGVKLATEKGKISQKRYDSYIRILTSL